MPPGQISGNVLVVTGMAMEARIASGQGIVTLLSGGDITLLRSRLAAIDPDALAAVVSFGLAGGLDTTLRAGDIVVATDVDHVAKTWPTNKAVTAAFMSKLSGRERGPILGRVAGSDSVVLDPAAKAVLHAGGAAAVDMESHVAAEFAAAHGLAFGVLRVVCDAAGSALPGLAQNALGAQGNVDLGAIVGSLMRDPSQVGALMRTGRDFAAALVALRRCRRLLGPGFGLLDRRELVLDVT